MMSGDEAADNDALWDTEGGTIFLRGRANRQAAFDVTEAADRAGESAARGLTSFGSMRFALRRPRAFWISICNIFGLLFSLTGVVLLFWYALPNAVPRGPGLLATGTGGGPAWEAENLRYRRNAYIGLFLVVAGTLMEAVPPLCPAIGSARRRAGVSQQAAVTRVRRMPLAAENAQYASLSPIPADIDIGSAQWWG